MLANLVQSYPLDKERRAGECFRDLLRRTGPIEFGYRVQGLAAHVLLRLGVEVLDVKASGHPDITAQDTLGILRIEVEADTGSLRERQLTRADFGGLAPQRPGDRGYFALLLTGPRIRWIVTAHQVLAGRHKPLEIATLTSLADRQLSSDWTEAMVLIGEKHFDSMWFYSFNSLRKRAIEGYAL